MNAGTRTDRWFSRRDNTEKGSHCLDIRSRDERRVKPFVESGRSLCPARV